MYGICFSAGEGEERAVMNRPNLKWIERWWGAGGGGFPRVAQETAGGGKVVEETRNQQGTETEG